MSIETLKSELLQIKEKARNKDWNSLSKRKLEELEFHDRDRDEGFKEEISEEDYEKYYSNKKYYNTTIDSVNYLEQWLISNAKDKVFLDYACGNGETAIKAAKYGAKLVIGIDISSVSVENAQKVSDKLGYDNCIFLQGDCEETGLPDECVDLLMCNGMLHHLDLSYAFPEMRRILKANGKVLAYEALDYNPFIKLYRMLTPAMRTDYEKDHILSLSDIKFAKRFFKIGEMKYWHITAFISAALGKGKIGKIMFSILNTFDKILSRIPGVRLMAWIFTFELIKEEES